MNTKPAPLPPFIDNTNIYSVEKLNNAINSELQQNFGVVYVEGEISNLAKPASGHLYFTLKDERSQIKCALFKGYRRFIKTKIENGQKILVKAKISIYVPRGDYQLIVEHAYPTGIGALQQAYEQLKTKLSDEGLFKQEHKKAIPKLPKQIFVVTSPTGAAIRDIISTLFRRFPSIPIKIIPTLVQGETAATNINKALKIADSLANKDLDVIILARGGGSLEDLWAFNDVQLAYTIFKAKAPIIAGIGHEVDFTIADFVADLRAATPTAAAENASPEFTEYLQSILNYQQILFKIITNKLFYFSQSTKHMHHRLLQQHPETKLNNQVQLVDEFYQKLSYLWEKQYTASVNQLKITNHKLEQNSPKSFITIQQNNINHFSKLLMSNIDRMVKQQQNNMLNLTLRLNSVNPLDILSRGYSVLSKKNGTIVTKKSQVKKGDKLQARLAQGSIDCEVL